MIESTILYLPTARTTYDTESAAKIFNQSKQYLSKICKKLIAPKDILTSVDELILFMNESKTIEIQSIIFQNITFVDGEFISAVMNFRKSPVLVWGVREPSVGGWLRFNSLTGVMSTANVLHNHKVRFSYVLGDPEEESLQKSIEKTLMVHLTLSKLNNLNIGVVGEYPPGFFFSDTNSTDLKKTFGTSIKKIDLDQAFEECLKIPESEYGEEIKKAQSQVANVDDLDKTVIAFAQFTAYIRTIIEEENIQSLAMRCWPNFFVKLQAAPCSVLSQLTQDGIVTACEADIHGSLTMYILRELSQGNAPFLGDIVNMNIENNTIILWHCGAGAYSLANEKTGAKLGVHPNRKVGFALDFGVKPGRVTLFRVGYSSGAYRFMVLKGEALDSPNSYNGTSAQVKLDNDVDYFIQDSIEKGFEPHFALVHGDVLEEIKELGRLLNIETIFY